eukprot:CAMPEP_0203681678 /NCGR_PEP_ID=MMETSP0090-20130426/43410_1 /ASSEMBLY_ACC=CAM_ASM_001088 /TAXON_ID=426623 /ORGANISM="Chaetoceros affinis, Strain CCMP159" /LENGTH=85 /DNA_ID=CAMNT_0050550253 /DNA_START=139 /DNA_END=393 /DNA_ORIENTATION=-
MTAWIRKAESLLTEIVEYSLVTAQNLKNGSFISTVDDNKKTDDKSEIHQQNEDNVTIWSSHLGVLNEWNSIHVDKINQLLLQLRE